MTTNGKTYINKIEKALSKTVTDMLHGIVMSFHAIGDKNTFQIIEKNMTKCKINHLFLMPNKT